MGYAREVSVLPGQMVHFHLSTTPSAPYQTFIYRLGWYVGEAATRPVRPPHEIHEHGLSLVVVILPSDRGSVF